LRDEAAQKVILCFKDARELLTSDIATYLTISAFKSDNFKFK